MNASSESSQPSPLSTDQHRKNVYLLFIFLLLWLLAGRRLPISTWGCEYKSKEGAISVDFFQSSIYDTGEGVRGTSGDNMGVNSWGIRKRDFFSAGTVKKNFRDYLLDVEVANPPPFPLTGPTVLKLVPLSIANEEVTSPISIVFDIFCRKIPPYHILWPRNFLVSFTMNAVYSNACAIAHFSQDMQKSFQKKDTFFTSCITMTCLEHMLLTTLKTIHSAREPRFLFKCLQVSFRTEKVFLNF